MKTVLIFTLTLALFLLGGYHPVGATTKHCHRASKFVADANKTRLTLTQQHSSIHTAVSTDDKQNIFSIEDEDEDSSFSRKYVQLNQFVTLFCVAYLFYICYISKKQLLCLSRLFIVRLQPYLLQGALRI
jgi:hypothetical protein